MPVEKHAGVEIEREKPAERELVATPVQPAERTYRMYPLKRLMAPGTGALLPADKEAIFFANKKERLAFLEKGLAADAGDAPRAKRGEIAKPEPESDEDSGTEKGDEGEKSSPVMTPRRRGSRTL